MAFVGGDDGVERDFHDDSMIGVVAAVLAGSSLGVGGASFRGGILSFIASKPFASANERIL